MPKYTLQGIVYRVVLHTSVRDGDLVEIAKQDPDTADDIHVLLQEIKQSQRLLEGLTVRDFGAVGDEIFKARPWVEQQRQGRNLWSLHFWDLENIGIRYRVIYTLDPRKSCYFVLAIVPRDFNYDSNHPRVRQLLDVYEHLDIPGFDGTH